MENNTLYLVIPCYNEEEVFPETLKRLTEKLNDMIHNNLISEKSRMLFVDDGSKDKTWQLIEEACQKNTLVCGVKLSRNKGHQNALMAGLTTAKDYADMVISMDADLQDDINAIDKFVEKYYEGCDIVYGVRSSRKKDTFFKRFTAEAFYKVMSLFGVEIVFNHADYRLMSKRAIDGLMEFKEVNLFLRGIVPMIGYQTGIVEYERSERFAGESKYPLKKMLNFAFDGITSFSIKPIRMITGVGVLMSSISLVVLIVGFILKLCSITFTSFYPICSVIFLVGGIQLIAIGIVGEYIGKIYMETKARPKFFIETFDDRNVT